MKSYMVLVHLYGSVAVVTLCPKTGPAGGAASAERLLQALAGIGAGVGSVVLDLDCAPRPALAEAMSAVDACAAQREVTVVALTPGRAPSGGHRPGAPALRARPAGPADGDFGPRGDGAAPVRRLRRVIAARALVHQAAGIRQARHRSHPCA
ncbi:hypothetical protein [Streptomyces sp. NPDC127114]|uniref:hypothetical protein n=1 Tax=Streptomyces sp. NPDC127114 TaxID=3345366 RepID=UPI00363B2D49